MLYHALSFQAWHPVLVIPDSNGSDWGHSLHNCQPHFRLRTPAGPEEGVQLFLADTSGTVTNKRENTLYFMIPDMYIFFHVVSVFYYYT